ncbi:MULTISPECIES: hypothetical protein [Xanthomonas]|uniref:hypothetical protein n=1 Tax=Xanthomonas TaxID=338 RepID=UPI001F0A1CE1|nr:MULTISPECIES: hypothetical protein [Xanthomonas]
MSRISSDIDLFTDDALHDPYPLYAELRNLGPAAYLRTYDLYYLGRYEQVRKALMDWQTFSSAQGAGLNPVINKQWEHALSASIRPCTVAPASCSPNVSVHAICSTSKTPSINAPTNWQEACSSASSSMAYATSPTTCRSMSFSI